MLEKPRLEDEKILGCLRNSYGLDATQIKFLPLGYDSYARVYRVVANGQAYFLKVKRDAVNELSVILPRWLKEQGLDQVVAPLPTITQELWGVVDGFTLILYPYIDSKAGAGAKLSDSQWIEFGAFLKRLHATQLPLELSQRMPRETFIPHPHWSAVMSQLQNDIGKRIYDHPIEKALAEFWRKQEQEIDLVVRRAEQLGQTLQRKASEFVLCHADIHTGNLIVSLQDELFVVDWDQPLLAPPERDLMFVTDGVFWTTPRDEELFVRGYGLVEIDPLAMAYYRYERAMEDLASFAESALLADASDETKQDSVGWFMKQFEPDAIIQAAHKLTKLLDN